MMRLVTAPTLSPLAAQMASAREAARDTAEAAHRESVRLRDDYLATEDAFINAVAAAQRAGEADWRQVYEAYLQVRKWSQLNGYTHFAERFQQRIPHDPVRLRQLAEAVPDPSVGGWSGATDWEGLERGGYPPNGVHVAFVLFGNAGQPLRYGATYKFKHYTGRMHKHEGLRWTSWRAVLARDEEDARAKKHELEHVYGRPNAASAAALSTAPTPTASADGVDGPSLYQHRPPSDGSSATDRWADGGPCFVRMGGTVYLAPTRPAELAQCTGLTKANARCRNTLDDSQIDVERPLAVPGGYIEGYDLDGTYSSNRPAGELDAEGRRWLAQRCRLHAQPSHPAAVEPEWTPFDPARHSNQVRTVQVSRDHEN